MERTVTIELEKTDCQALEALSAWTGFPPEMAALYAVRLVSACLREGLLGGGEPSRGWPEEARLMTGTGGKVIAFPDHDAEKKGKDEASV